MPFWANTQLLWYRRSVAARAGVDPSAGPVSWQTILDAAVATGTTVAVPAARYEGYLVWINALVASAGGEILRDPQAGRDAQAAIGGAAGRRAAAVIAALAHSPAADPGLATAMEESARATFQGARGGFMVNWPYVYGAAREAVADGVLPRAVLDDIAWTRYPAIGGGRAEPAAARRYRSRDQRLQPASRPGPRGAALPDIRRQPDAVHAVGRQSRGACRGV